VKAGALGLAIVGLLLTVALAARGGHPTGDGRVSQRQVPYALQDSLVTLIAIVYAVAIVAAIIVLFRRRHQWREPESHWLRNACAVLLVMLLVTVGYWAIARRPSNNQAEEVHIGQKQRQGGARSRIRPIPPRHAKFNWPLAFSLIGLVLVGGTIVFIRVRRPLSPPAAQGSVEEELAQAVETTIEDLRLERDARRAVIAAYASMERVVSSHGLARHRAETPFEYLARILGELRVRESAVHSLTQLFEYAKFSPHEIDSAMKEEAIAALSNVRDDLRRDQALAA
jgi:hypothetical protein